MSTRSQDNPPNFVKDAMVSGRFPDHERYNDVGAVRNLYIHGNEIYANVCWESNGKRRDYLVDELRSALPFDDF